MLRVNTDINTLHSCARKRHWNFTVTTRTVCAIAGSVDSSVCLGRPHGGTKIANPVHSFTEASYESSALGIGLGLAALCCAVGASAQASVLERVAGGGKLVIAYRESSVPFSYIDSQSGKPVGYALDLCLRMAELVRKKTGKKDMEIELVPVTPANRIAMIEQGKADMECGSTTNNAERRQKVAFTIPHFITGARLLVKSSSTIDRVEDLNGKKLVSTKGTTPLKAADQANRERLMGITIVEAPDHAKAVEMVEKGEADAFVMDDVLLYGLAAGRPDPKRSRWWAAS